MEEEQVAKFRNLRNSAGCENSQPCNISAGCENSQPCNISAVSHFSSVYGSNFLQTSIVSFEFGLDSSCLD